MHVYIFCPADAPIPITQNSDQTEWLSDPISSNRLDTGKGQYVHGQGQPQTSSQGKALLHNFLSYTNH